MRANRTVVKRVRESNTRSNGGSARNLGKTLRAGTVRPASSIVRSIRLVTQGANSCAIAV